MNRTQGIAALAAITLGALVGGAAFSRLHAAPGVFAHDVGATHDALSRTGSRLADIAAKADAQAAARMLDEVTLMARQLNDSHATGSGMLNCRAAGGHLAQGAADLSAGQPWSSTDDFRAALAACR